MGSCISRIYDDYTKYVSLCKKVKEEPVVIHDAFIEHEKELLKKYNYEEYGCSYRKIV